MRLDAKTLKELVAILAPFMKTESERRALLHEALGDSPLLKQIEYIGPSRSFVLNVISQLEAFGDIEPGKSALWALLEVVREQVGEDRRKRIDALGDILGPYAGKYVPITLDRPMIYTFYSFKGGVGRSMALANVAELLARGGLNVLMVDWDLEAPGLEEFFEPYFEGASDKVQAHIGVIDMLMAFKDRLLSVSIEAEATEDEIVKQLFGNLDLFIVEISADYPRGGRLSLLPAGRRGKESKYFSDYARRVQQFDWFDFYKRWEGERYFEWFRRQVKEQFDVILVDSRTGVNEMSGVCTYQLADVVVMFVAANDQNLKGVQRMAEAFVRESVTEARTGKGKLQLLPVPSRVDASETVALNTFKEDFLKFFSEFIPPELRRIYTISEGVEIPYIPLYGYKEMIAAREQESLNKSPQLVRAYKTLADYLQILARQENRMMRSR